MTFVRRGLSRRIAGREATEALGSDFPDHFRIGYGARYRRTFTAPHGTKF